MTVPLREARHRLGELLADHLDVAVAPFGTDQINPPCVYTRMAPTYIEVTGYSTDKVYLEALVIPGPGEGSASVDELDDLLDQVRAALLTPFPDVHPSPFAGFRFSFTGVRLDEAVGAIVDITYERNDD